jgi:hypothetical protein
MQRLSAINKEVKPGMSMRVYGAATHAFEACRYYRLFALAVQKVIRRL